MPEFTAPVTRAKRILLRAWTPEQKEIEIEAEELLAVALQHEIDHLDGKLFLDRISRLKRDLYRARQRKLERQGRPARPARGAHRIGPLSAGAAPWRVVFMGTPPFARTILDALLGPARSGGGRRVPAGSARAGAVSPSSRRR